MNLGALHASAIDIPLTANQHLAIPKVQIEPVLYIPLKNLNYWS